MANSSMNSSLTIANITSAATFPAHVQRAHNTLCAHKSRMLRRCLRYMYVCIICIIICIYAFCEDVSGAQVSPPLPPLSPRIDSSRCREAPPRKSNTGCTMHVTDKTDAASSAHIEAKPSPPLLVWWILGLLCDSPQLRRAECIVLPSTSPVERQKTMPGLVLQRGASSGSNPVKHVARGENGGKWRKAECNVSRCQPLSGDICYLQYVKRGQKWRLGEWNEDKNDLSGWFWQSQAHVPDFLCLTFFPRTASQFRITCICLQKCSKILCLHCRGGHLLQLPGLPSIAVHIL